MLADVRSWWETFIFPYDSHDLDVLTLWTVHTHLVTETWTSPRLLIDSPVPGSGKTTVLEHLLRLAYDPISMASLSSPAMLARLLDTRMRTLLIDEADRSLNPDNPKNEDLVAILNSGYKHGGTRPVLVPLTGGGWDVKEMSTYAPVALAGNQPKMAEDTRSRCIRVLLLPAPDDSDVAETDWEVLEDSARALQGRVAAWADSVRAQVKERPELPDAIRGRFKERWLPLKRVAVAAGGHWPALVDELAMADLEQLKRDKEDGMVTERPAMLLLKDISTVWKPGPFMATKDIINLLIQSYPDRWGTGPLDKPLNAHRLGRMLSSSWKISSVQQHRGGPRGYTRHSFLKAWAQLGVTPASDPAGPLLESDASDATAESDACECPNGHHGVHRDDCPHSNVVQLKLTTVEAS